MAVRRIWPEIVSTSGNKAQKEVHERSLVGVRHVDCMNTDVPHGRKGAIDAVNSFSKSVVAT